jgi:hypothetical protein
MAGADPRLQPSALHRPCRCVMSSRAALAWASGVEWLAHLDAERPQRTDHSTVAWQPWLTSDNTVELSADFSNGLARRADQKGLVFETLLLTWVVGWINIRYCKRPLTVDLDNGRTACPSKMIHFRWGFAVSARRKFYSFFFIKFVAHPNVKITGYDRNVFRCRMIVRSNLIAARHFQTDNVGSIFGWVAR